LSVAHSRARPVALVNVSVVVLIAGFAVSVNWLSDDDLAMVAGGGIARDIGIAVLVEHLDLNPSIYDHIKKISQNK